VAFVDRVANDTEALLDLAVGRAPIARGPVSIVAGFPSLDPTVATHWNHLAQITRHLLGQ
jgi:hypothetical protein